jgi:hypothetical protein
MHEDLISRYCNCGIIGQRYRLPNSDDTVEDDSGFFSGSSIITCFELPRRRATGFAAAGGFVGLAAGSSAFMASR